MYKKLIFNNWTSPQISVVSNSHPIFITGNKQKVNLPLLEFPSVIMKSHSCRALHTPHNIVYTCITHNHLRLPMEKLKVYYIYIVKYCTWFLQIIIIMEWYLHDMYLYTWKHTYPLFQRWINMWKQNSNWNYKNR